MDIGVLFYFTQFNAVNCLKPNQFQLGSVNRIWPNKGRKTKMHLNTVYHNILKSGSGDT